MSLDLFSCIKGFVAVVEQQGFASASRHIHVSASMLTKQVKYLEKILSKKLLYRTTRRLQLTEAGDVYLVQAKKILEQVENAKDVVLAIDREPHGQLTIGFPSVFDSVFPLYQLASFLEKFPKIKIRTIPEHSPATLTTGLADLVISPINSYDKQFVKKHVFTSRRSIVISPKYIEKHGKPSKISELQSHNCLMNKTIFPTDEWSFENNKKIKVNGNYESPLTLDTYFAAIHGVGLLCVPDAMVETEIKTGRLKKVELESEPVSVELFLYYFPVNYSNNVSLLAKHLIQHSNCCK